MQHGTALSNDVLVTAAPAAAHYIPDFITVEEEEYLLRKASSTQRTYVMTRARTLVAYYQRTDAEWLDRRIAQAQLETPW
ncbi:hypothetical protein JVT61DRAFT_14472 [Boletus reticuloceps]|uniref:Uncharacterized protein n=1 Tax=Boletus reticuloceps TaxID=495285 RepID=A0A8I2YUP7_9AGAM|nr:hypothetical protein JVT61DRAFT_14472 [Boletus reticuloceps]